MGNDNRPVVGKIELAHSGPGKVLPMPVKVEFVPPTAVMGEPESEPVTLCAEQFGQLQRTLLIGCIMSGFIANGTRSFSPPTKRAELDEAISLAEELL